MYRLKVTCILSNFYAKLYRSNNSTALWAKREIFLGMPYSTVRNMELGIPVTVKPSLIARASYLNEYQRGYVTVHNASFLLPQDLPMSFHYAVMDQSKEWKLICDDHTPVFAGGVWTPRTARGTAYPLAPYCKPVPPDEAGAERALYYRNPVLGVWVKAWDVVDAPHLPWTEEVAPTWDIPDNDYMLRLLNTYRLKIENARTSRKKGGRGEQL